MSLAVNKFMLELVNNVNYGETYCSFASIMNKKIKVGKNRRRIISSANSCDYSISSFVMRKWQSNGFLAESGKVTRILK